MKAFGISSQTLAARGNCFSVKADEGCFNIVNFSVETLEKVIEKGICSWPVEIKVIGGEAAIIHDTRIPEKLYRSRYCEVCCPFDFLPQNQKDAIERENLRKNQNGIVPAWDLSDFEADL